MSKRLFATAAALALFAVAACGGDDDAGPTSPSEPAPAAAASTDATNAPDASGAAETDPATSGPNGFAPAGELSFSYYILPTSYDPHKSTNAYDFIGLALTYDRLVHLTPAGEPVAGLATDWEFSDDGLTLDFTIREGVEFHDGEPLTPEAVVTSLDRGRTLEGSTAASSLQPVESIEVVDGTVRLHLSEPAAQLPLVLADRAGMIISPAAIEGGQLDQSPAGTGMYELTDLRPGDVATYAAVDGYWDPAAIGLETIVYRQLPDLNAALNGARSGELDVVPVDASNIPTAESSGLEIVSGPTVTLQGIQFNRAVAPFDDVLVRRAINHAIDRQALIDGLFAGHGATAGQMFLDTSPAFDPDTGPDPFPYDPELARSLLRDAGLADGFEMELIASSINSHQLLATAIQGQLAEIGVTVNVRTLPPEEVNEVVYVNQDLQAQLTFPGQLDASIMLNDFFAEDSFRNPGRHTTPGVVDALARASEPGDDRDAALQEASALVTDEALVAPLVFPNGNYAVASHVTGWEHWVSAKPEFRGVRVSEP